MHVNKNHCVFFPWSHYIFSATDAVSQVDGDSHDSSPELKLIHAARAIAKNDPMQAPVLQIEMCRDYGEVAYLNLLHTSAHD